jgi:peptidoglycan/LPS O-acetylase OafA/YrhL
VDRAQFVPVEADSQDAASIARTRSWGGMMERRFDQLEGARGILACWVVFSHLLQHSDFSYADLSWPLTLVRNGGLAVRGFMILSGFVITHLLLSKHEPYRLYLCRRFLRLFPVLAICVLFILCVSFLVSPKIFRFDRELLPYYLAGHATLLQSVIPEELVSRASHGLLPPSWSISLEWQFYLVAPAILLALRRGGLAAGALLATLVATYWITGFAGQFTLFGHTLTFGHAAFLPLSLPYFLVGMLSYLALPRVVDLAPATPQVLLAMSLVFFLTDPALGIWALVFLELDGASHECSHRNASCTSVGSPIASILRTGS